MNQTCFIYCVLAAGNFILSMTAAPSSFWEWFKASVGIIVSFFLAWKTYLSQPKP